MPSFCQHFIEVSDILTCFLHGMIKRQLTLPICKVHLKKKWETHSITETSHSAIISLSAEGGSKTENGDKI